MTSGSRSGVDGDVAGAVAAGAAAAGGGVAAGFGAGVAAGFAVPVAHAPARRNINPSATARLSSLNRIRGSLRSRRQCCYIATHGPPDSHGPAEPHDPLNPCTDE